MSSSVDDQKIDCSIISTNPIFWYHVMASSKKNGFHYKEFPECQKLKRECEIKE